MVQCLIALGSNQGDRVGNLVKAVDLLRQNPGVRVDRVSSFHETAPVGGPPGQRAYFNAAVTIETGLARGELMSALLATEQKLGRERAERWGPRTIDVDLLLYGDRVIESAELAVPHPRMQERRFVLGPAAEIASDRIHPRLRQTVGQLL